MFKAQVIINFEETKVAELPKEKFVQYEESDKWWMLALGMLKEEKVLSTVVLDECMLNNFEYKRSVVYSESPTIPYARECHPVEKLVLSFEVESFAPARVSYI